MAEGCPLPALRLRAMEPEDLDFLYTIENDVDIWDVGMTNVPYSRYALHNYMANVSNDIYADRQVRLIVENGIVIGKEHRKKGFATAALGLLADYAASVLHIHQLYVVVSIDNEPSLRLFEKLGYRNGTVLKDWLFDGKNYHDAVLMQLFL